MTLKPFSNSKKMMHVFALASLVVVSFAVPSRFMKDDRRVEEHERLSEHQYDQILDSSSAAENRTRMINITVTPWIKTSEAGAKWTKPQLCPPNYFVRGFRQWQDRTSGDWQGLVKLELDCMPANLTRKHEWISVGTRSGESRQPRYCTFNAQFFIGMAVVFGGPHIGVTEVMFHCDAPDWSASRHGHFAKPKMRVLTNSISVFRWRVQKAAYKKTDWEKSRDVYCPEDYAISGISASVDTTTGFFSDDSGINLIRFHCRPFPFDLVEREETDEGEI